MSAFADRTRLPSRLRNPSLIRLPVTPLRRYHPAMAAVVPVRRALRVRTAFNILGPLLNPAGATYGLIGVYSTAIAPLDGIR